MSLLDILVGSASDGMIAKILKNNVVACRILGYIASWYMINIDSVNYCVAENYDRQADAGTTELQAYEELGSVRPNQLETLCSGFPGSGV